MAGRLRRFLCLFAQEHMDFRIQELQAIVSSFDGNVTINEKDYTNKSPYLVFSAFSEHEARQISDRSVLIKAVYELFGVGESYENLKEDLLKLPPEIFEPYTKPDYTFAIRVRAFNKKLSSTYMINAIEWLSFLPFGGCVKLQDPSHEFHLLEDYGDNPNVAPPTPKRVYFGRLLSLGQRHLFHRYSLKTRHFIGNTSMDPQLALVMANMAKVTPGSLVYDPFAGSGSILVACAHYGGYVLGCDIDWNIVHGKGLTSRSDAPKQLRGEDESVRHNMEQYSLQQYYIDMLVHDASYCIWKDSELFDAIVTDPPYGIRESSKRVKDDDHQLSPSLTDDIEQPQDGDSTSSSSSLLLVEKTHYNLSSVINDLVQFAAKFLVLGGRLVYWLPFYGKEFDPTIIPTHPCLTLISMSQQPLAYHLVSRWLITMEKSLPFNPSLHHNTTTKLQESSPVLDDFRHKYFQKPDDV